MILVDTALQKREAEGKPIRVGIVGAGFMARGLTNQIVNSVPGMRVVAIYNRRLARAVDAFSYAGREAVVAETQKAFDDAVSAGRPVATEDAMLLARSEHVDVLVETTARTSS
jgi:predicted homoserine dehydrogenase-like protein